ncbi:hypothetical protein KW798_00230, partial [Candidatus Parcubacteria bacterium]|nr:hypothetical protein [Candidatus Parcubacteria bacterium]
MNKHRMGFVAIVATLLLTALPALASHSWGTYHWARTANPFTIQLGDNLASSWDAYLNQTSSDWSTSTVLDTIVVPGNTNKPSGFNTPKRCAPTTGRVEVCNYKYGNVGWLG